MLTRLDTVLATEDEAKKELEKRPIISAKQQEEFNKKIENSTLKRLKGATIGKHRLTGSMRLRERSISQRRRQVSSSNHLSALSFKPSRRMPSSESGRYGALFGKSS